MGVNKVVLNTADGEETLIDLTGDTVTPETLAEGATAHDSTGEKITGTMSTSGGGVSGPVSWNDLTDKPFYETIAETDIVPYEEYVLTYENGWMYQDMLTDNVTLSEGDSIKVMFDGAEYEHTLVTVYDMLAFGNVDKGLGQGDTGEPYFGALMPAQNAWGLFTFDDAPTDASATVTHSFGLSAVALVAKKVDTKFLYRPDWTNNDPTSFSSIKGRPFGEVKAGQLVYSRTHKPMGSFEGPDGSMVAIAMADGTVDIRACVIEGATYLVTLNGVEYTITATNRHLGDIENYVETPFNISYDGTIYWLISAEDYAAGNTSAEITVKFLTDKDNYGYAYLPLPAEFLPEGVTLPTLEYSADDGKTLVAKDGVWNLGFTSWNDLTDKPFGMVSKTLMTWDGDTTGLPYIDLGEGVKAYKISDTPVTVEEIIGAEAMTVANGTTTRVTIQESDISQQVPTIIVIARFIFSALEDTALEANLTVTKGLWHIDPSAAGFYASSAVANIPKTIDIEYIPQELYTEIDNRIDAYINDALGGEY